MEKAGMILGDSEISNALGQKKDDQLVEKRGEKKCSTLVQAGSKSRTTLSQSNGEGRELLDPDCNRVPSRTPQTKK